AHHAEARADLVAELGLDLVETRRQLLVAGQLVAREVGDDLLVGRPVAVPGLLAVLHFHQLAAELLPAPGFFPQLARLHVRHQHFDGAGGVHLLAHHLFHLAQHAQAERRPGIEPGGELADHARLEHQLVAGELGFGRDFLAGTEVELRQTHGGQCLNRGRPAFWHVLRRTLPAATRPKRAFRQSADAGWAQCTRIEASASCSCAWRWAASSSLSATPSPSVSSPTGPSLLSMARLLRAARQASLSPEVASSASGLAARLAAPLWLMWRTRCSAPAGGGVSE